MFEELEKFISAELESRGHPGSSVAVVRDDRVVWANGFGYCDIERKLPATPETVYRCASVTKPVVATGFLQLMEQGKFNLDDPVNDHLDVKIKTRYEKQPTIRDLLTHHSGMPTRVPPLYYDQSEALKLGDYIPKAARTIRPPKESYAYCNTAFAIVGHLIELFSGKPYDEYVTENVLRPLEMSSSAFQSTQSIKKRLAQGYERAGGPDERLEAVKEYILGTIPQDPAGSLYSTVNDLSHFLIAHMNKGAYKGRRILKEDTVEEMHKLQASAGSSRSGMALSWFRSIHDGHVMLSHTGGLPDFTNHVALYPELKIGASWLSNLSDGSAWRPPAPTALRIIAGETPFNPKALQAVPNEWRNLIGRYGARGHEYMVKVENGYLMVEGPEGSVSLEKTGECTYLVHGVRFDGYELTFEYDKMGKAAQFELENQVVPRYAEVLPVISEQADLIGSWRGEYAHPYGVFNLTLNIEGLTDATATDMNGRKLPVSGFKAEKGRVTGTYGFAPPREYVGWGAREFQVKLDLAAVNDELKGLITFSSKRAASRLTLPLTLARV